MSKLNIFNKTNVLFLAPHTDDVELGCGATLARCIDECASVHVAAFSTATSSLPQGSAPTLLKDEFFEAMATYGLDESFLHVYDYEVRKLNYRRQEVLEDMVKLRKNIQPDVVFVTSSQDVHQDHQVIHTEAVRAFKTSTSILGYELPWNHFDFSTRAFVTVTEAHLNKKLRALQSYKSQLVKGRDYFDPEITKGLARVRGLQVGQKYAEAYEVITIKI